MAKFSVVLGGLALAGITSFAGLANGESTPSQTYLAVSQDEVITVDRAVVPTTDKAKKILIETLLAKKARETAYPVNPENIGGIDVDLSNIINLGQFFWKIIDENRPTASIAYQYASALPAGVASAGELEGFSDLNWVTYRTWGTNFFGMTMFEVDTTVLHQYGGRYRGHGRYLTTVSIVPTKVEVSWGYNINSEATVVSTSNVGSSNNPVAALVMEQKLDISTLFSSNHYVSIFYFRGDSPEFQLIEQ